MKNNFFVYSVGILAIVVVLGWTTWYFAIVHPKLIAEPIIRYNTESQIAADNTPDATSVKTSQGQKISQEKNETVDRHVEGGSTENAAPLVSKN